MPEGDVVWVRGAGELGSGVAHLLYRVGYRVFMSEIFPPLAIRRPVTFSDAILENETLVDGICARKYENNIIPTTKSWNHIPIFIDEPEKLLNLKPHVIVDARMLKHYEKDFRSWATLIIGLGPGFQAGQNCHRAIETMRGHDLARVLTSGSPLEDTGIPGNIAGQTSQRLIRAPYSGQVKWLVDFGDIVQDGQQIGLINDSVAILAPLGGIVRGLISPRTPVSKGMKIGDIDPRGDIIKYREISEKARAIAAGVFEAVIIFEKANADD